MKELKEEVDYREVETLKQQILSLKEELLQLSAECHRLEEKALQKERIALRIGERKAEIDSTEEEHPLFAENEMLKAVIENIGVAVGITDSSGNTLSLNNAALKLHGFKTDDEILPFFKQYTDAFELHYPDGSPLPDYDWPLSKAMRGDFVHNLEVILTRRRDDVKKLVSYNAEPVFNNLGDLMLVVYTISEYPFEKQKNQNTRESELRLRNILNNATIGIVEVDIHNRFVFVNRHMSRILGYDEQELLQKTVTDITVPEDREHNLQLLKKLHSGEESVVNYEKRYNNAEGQPLWVNVSLSALRDKQGNYLSSIGTVSDITERKLVEQALIDSESRFRLLADNISQMAFIADNLGKPIWYNKRWFDFTGVSLYEMQQGGHAKVNHPDHVERVLAGFLNSIKHGTPWEDSYMMRRTDGVYRWFLSRAQPIYDEQGNITLWFGTSTDITDQKLAEEEANRRATEIEAILSCIPYGIMVYDDKGYITRANKAAANILNVPEISKDYFTRVTKHYQVWNESGKLLDQEEMPGYRASIGKETVMNEILQLKGLNMSGWFIVNAAPLMVSGNHSGAVLSMLDVTSRKEMEEKMSESEQRLRAMFDNAAIGMLEVDENDKILAVNKLLCNILGYYPEQLIGKTIFEITYPEDRPESHRLNSLLHKKEISMFSYEKRYLKSDGTPVWVNVTVSAISFMQGTVIRSIGTVENISERKKIEQALRESEEMFSKMFEFMPVSVSLSTTSGEFFNVNKAWLTLFGYAKKEEVIGKTSLELRIVHPESTKKIKEELSIHGFVRNEELVLYAKSGEKHTVLVNIDYIQVWNQKLVLTTIEDISEQKKIELEIKHKNEELTRFIYTVSHDLKSPLVTIKSFTSFLWADFEMGDKQALDKDIKYIQNAAEKMGKLLDELLELSRIGRKEESKTKVPLFEIAQAAVDLVAGRINAIKAEIRFSGPKVSLYGYTPRLVQLFQNLIDNAVKFMGDQQNPVIEIGTLIERDRTVLFVKDNGSGIDPRYHHKIFGLFEKLDTGIEGTGIGLALVKRIIEVHNGSIWFKSDGVGQGTTFYFTLEETSLL